MITGYGLGRTKIYPSEEILRLLKWLMKDIAKISAKYSNKELNVMIYILGEIPLEQHPDYYEYLSSILTNHKECKNFFKKMEKKLNITTESAINSLVNLLENNELDNLADKIFEY